MIWDLDPVLLRIGALEIRYYGILFAAAFAIGLPLWRRQMLRGGHTIDQADSFILWAFVAVVAGARLGSVLFYELDAYLARPWEIFFIWQGGMASHGAYIGLIAALILFARRERIPVLKILDRFTFPAALAVICIRLGNFTNSEIVGQVTDLPWGVRFPRSAFDAGLPLELVPPRHPFPLYIALYAALLLLVLFLVDRHYGERRPLGLLAGLFLSLDAIGRIGFEFLKESPRLSLFCLEVTTAQILSTPLLLFGAWMLVRSFQSRSGLSMRPGPTNEISHSVRNDSGERNSEQ